MKTKYRIKFKKQGKIKFIGHLDLLNVFQRAIKRADLPICFSEGYNPHQLLSFALPLPIGMESEGEYADVTLTCEADVGALAALREALPIGLSITGWKQLPPNAKSAASLVDGADYAISFPENGVSDGWKPLLQDSQQIIVCKKTKTSAVELDIKPDIHAFEIMGNILQARLSAGGRRMLKPQLLLSYLYEKSGLTFDPYAVRYTRKDLLQRVNGCHISLGEDE